MVTKNLMTLIEKGRETINPYYDASYDNIVEIRDRNRERNAGELSMISDGFIFGYVQGLKAAKAKKK